MSPRKHILRHLQQVHRDSPGELTPARGIQGFDPADPKHTQAMNQLLKDRLINGQKADDGGMAIQLNPGNMAAVNKALRPWYAHPALWAVAVLVAGMGTASVLLGG